MAYRSPIKLIGFAIVGGADVNKFTLNGSELTFKATEFKDGNNTYRVNIKATWKKPGGTTSRRM
ncbi:hypothetical protein BSPWISOXPB_2645 [uncultured Gammaproteobacteria bacterium]|nr:hypothetical protein BSPWISOXPB_2645 [uncultured Gammaproteobacteria bacterium]